MQLNDCQRQAILGTDSRFWRSSKRLAKQILGGFLPVRFGNRPRKLKINRPVSIRGASRIFFGEGVHIGPRSFLKAITKTSSLMRHPGGDHIAQTFDSKIVIGNRVSATSELHLAAHVGITIEDDVMLASNVFIADASHGYENATIPYRYQGMTHIAPILIKSGCWIGQNVVILPGVTIGELSIIGANSVVTKSIPARCIAVGSPARVIKRWCTRTDSWITEKADRSPVTKWENDALDYGVGVNSVKGGCD
jgi:acetyltransferase-like isoleucine patch superfamily enzyme